MMGIYSWEGVEHRFQLFREPASKEIVKNEAPSKGPRRFDVSVRVEGAVLKGTIHVPRVKNFPAVILVNGSEACSRDGTIPGQARPGLRLTELIADGLVAHDVAVLCLDSRGIGESTGKHSDTELRVLANDVIAAKDILRTLKGVDAGRVGLVCHSMGGTIGLIACKVDPSISFLICINTPVIAGDAELYLQAERSVDSVMEQAGKTPRLEQSKREFMARLRSLLEIAKSDLGQEDAIKRVLSMEGAGLLPTDSSHSREYLLRYLSPLYRSYIRFDPAPDLISTKLRVMLIFGENDTLVDSRSQIRRVHDINLKRPVVSVIDVLSLPGLGHCLESNHDLMPPKDALAPVVDVSCLDDLAVWIKK